MICIKFLVDVFLCDLDITALVGLQAQPILQAIPTGKGDLERRGELT